MGNCINQSTFQAEQATVTKKYEDAILDGSALAYNTARSDIEAIINTTTYAELEVDVSNYPTGMEKVVSIFPVVDGQVQKTIVIQILYQCTPDTSTHYLLHLALLPGSNHEAITLVPHKNNFPEDKPDDHQYDHTSLNTVSTVPRKQEECPEESWCYVKVPKPSGCCEYYEYESGCGNY